MHVARLGRESLDKHGERESFHFDGRWFTNREMQERAGRIAAGLRDLGVKPGDRVGVVLSNRPEVLNVATEVREEVKILTFSLTADLLPFLRDGEAAVRVQLRIVQFQDQKPRDLFLEPICVRHTVTVPSGIRALDAS